MCTGTTETVLTALYKPPNVWLLLLVLGIDRGKHTFRALLSLVIVNIPAITKNNTFKKILIGNWIYSYVC